MNIIPMVLDIDLFHGPVRFAGEARRAARCGASGKRRNTARGPDRPTSGRILLAASGVAPHLKWATLRRGALLPGGKNHLGETGQYQGPLV